MLLWVAGASAKGLTPIPLSSRHVASSATPKPVVRASGIVVGDFHLLTDSPTRPKNSRKIVATVGRVLGYHLLVTIDKIGLDGLISSRITIWDERAQEKRTFSLSFTTTINGIPLRCDDAVRLDPNSAKFPIEQAIAEDHLCRKLPSTITLGKTRVVMVYWLPLKADPHKSLLLYVDQLPHSDAMYIIPESK